MVYNVEDIWSIASDYVGFPYLNESTCAEISEDWNISIRMPVKCMYSGMMYA